mgnify:CR=1 FL=1
MNNTLSRSTGLRTRLSSGDYTHGRSIEFSHKRNNDEH